MRFITGHKLSRLVVLRDHSVAYSIWACNFWDRFRPSDVKRYWRLCDESQFPRLTLKYIALRERILDPAFMLKEIFPEG